MKIKINKEQIAYLNSLPDKEDKKTFLIDCFLGQMENDIEISFNTTESDIFKQNEDIPKPISCWMYKGNITSEFPVLKLDDYPIEKTSKRIIESLSKEQLKDITKPTVPKNFLDKWLDEGIHVTEYGVRPIYNFKLLEELKNYEPPHPDKVKKYTKEDLENAFNTGRNSFETIDFTDYYTRVIKK